MRISDWSSDVCSSDLADGAGLSADHTLLSGAPALCARPARYAQSPHIRPCYVLRSFLPHSMRSHRIFANEPRSEEHTSELQSLMRISYAVFCLKKKKNNKHKTITTHIPRQAHNMTLISY